MKKILLLGSRGRLGAALARKWHRGNEVHALSRAEADVGDSDSLRRMLGSREYDVLVNCTGATSLEQCEENPDLAHLVNAKAPQVMAEAASATGARLIHFSTDYVFDGLLERPYTETDIPNPLSVYGKTKLLGEQAVINTPGDHLSVRVSWVFGPDKPSFIDMILSRALAGQTLEAVADKTSCPTSSEDVADWLAPFFSPGLPGGILHACNSGTASWQEYGQAAVDIAGQLGWPVVSRTVNPIALASVAAFRASRPPHTPMDCSRLENVTKIRPRPWREALESYMKDAGGPDRWVTPA